MVSKRRDPPASRDKLLAAATAEFAARGFDGAKVDRIAAKARINKAMIYYHFKDKAALYREILAGVFRSIADAVSANVTDGPPETQLRQFIQTIATEATRSPHFASMWLREMADRGVHIDDAIVTELRRVLFVLGGIIQRGQQQGHFGPAHPLVTQLGIVAPILFFVASKPVRERVAKQGVDVATPQHDDVLRHIETATLGALRGTMAGAEGTAARSRRQQR